MSRPNPESRNGYFTASYVDSGGYSATETRAFISTYRTYTSVNSPNYYESNKYKHGLPANDHFMKVTKRTEKPIRRTQRAIIGGPTPWTDYTDQYGSVIGIPNWGDHGWDISHSEQAIRSARDNVKQKVLDQKVNLAQVFAERQRTIDTVADSAFRIARALLAAKKGNLGQAAKHLGIGKPSQSTTKNMASNWLALQYGWRPLLNDIYGTCEALAQSKFPPILKFRARTKVSDSKLHYEQYESSSWGKLTQDEIGYESHAEIMLAYNMGNDINRSMSQLGISNPATIAWELMPWSFVIDWFLPVGKFINSIGFDAGLVFRMGYETQFTKNNWVITAATKATDFTGGYNLRTVYLGGIIVQTSNVMFTRKRLLGPPAISLPQFKNPLSLEHSANAFALLKSVRR